MVRWLPLFPRQGRGFIDDLTEVFCGEDGQAVKQFGVTAGRNTALSTDAFREKVDDDNPHGV